MKKLILIALAVVLVVALGAGAVWASNSQPASKATAAVGYINVLNSESLSEQTILSQEIKIPGNKKDLFVDVSLETGLYTDTLVKSKGGIPDESSAWARLEVMVQATPIDKNGDPIGLAIIAHPNVIVGYDNGDPVYNGGWVTFDYRMQYLSATLQGIIDFSQLQCGEFGCTLPLEGLTEEEIQLVLDTMAAHSFNFILPDLPVATYLVEVRAKIDSDTSKIKGSAEANATIGLGSVTIEAVRMIRGEVIEVVSPPEP